MARTIHKYPLEPVTEVWAPDIWHQLRANDHQPGCGARRGHVEVRIA